MFRCQFANLDAKFYMLTLDLGLLPKKVHQDQEKFCLYCIDKDMQRLLSMFIAFTVVAGGGVGREGISACNMDVFS